MIATYQPAQTPNPKTRPMPPPGTVCGASALISRTPANIQIRKSSQMPNPSGTRMFPFLRRMTAIATAIAKKISCASPSAHQIGNPR